MSPSSARPSNNTRSCHSGNSCLALPRGSGSHVREPTPREATEKPPVPRSSHRREMDSRCLKAQGAALIRVKECCICWDGISRDPRSTKEHFSPRLQHTQANRQEVSVCRILPLLGFQLIYEGLKQHSCPCWNITMSFPCTSSLTPGLCFNNIRSQPAHDISAQYGHGQLNPEVFPFSGLGLHLSGEFL
ncbi:hypothetical protein Nmel_018137 [Mimus melanotis]